MLTRCLSCCHSQWANQLLLLLLLLPHCATWTACAPGKGRAHGVSKRHGVTCACCGVSGQQGGTSCKCEKCLRSGTCTSCGVHAQPLLLSSTGQTSCTPIHSRAACNGKAMHRMHGLLAPLLVPRQRPCTSFWLCRVFSRQRMKPAPDASISSKVRCQYLGVA
jgi:hypothetical protein